MKIKSVQALVLGAIFSVAAMTPAVAHETPTAPADWLAKTNPQDADDLDMKKVKKLYKRKCKKCHGMKGNGKGSAAGDLEIKATAFNEPGYLEGRKDGQLFWMLMEGSEGTDMEPFGPGTDVNLSEDQLWQLITYMRSAYTK